MCATGDQTALEGEQLQAYQQAQQMTAEQYSDQKSIYAPMAAQFQSLLAKGPNSKGFSDEEEGDLNAQAVEGTAENYRGAAKAVNENLATEGGGNNPLPTGAQAQLKSETAQSSAQEQSKEEQQIQQADYAQGYKNWETAGQGLETIAAGENPLGFESAATGSGSAAGTTAEQIAQEQNSWENAAIGAVGTAAGGWAGGGFKTPGCWVAAELYGGWNDPRTQALRQWIFFDFGETWYGWPFAFAYLLVGKRLAASIKNHTWLRRPFRWLFDMALRKATK